MNINALWGAYQDGQGNADKTAREVFYEVVEPYLIAQKAPVAEVPCSDGLSASQLIEPGYYWWLPQCERKNPDKQESWSIISWHPKIPDGRQGVFVGPLKKPSR